MPLSGENSGHGGGDVLLPADSPYLVECKLRARFAHHALFKAAKADAKKHGKPWTLLFTKQKYEDGFLVTMDAELFKTLYYDYEDSRI